MTIIKYVVYWGAEIYDSYSSLADAEDVVKKYSNRYPGSKSNFRITKQTVTEEEILI
jgi:hypothetical protein